MEPDVVDTPVEEVETESTGPARDEQGRFAGGADAPALEAAPEVAEPELDEEGNPVVAEAAPDPAAEADKAIADWKPFAVKLHGEEKPLDWANHLDGESGGIY